MLDRLPYDVILNNVIVNNIYSLFVHNYDINGLLNLKLVNRTFYRIINEEKIYKEIFNLRKHLFFVNSFSEYKTEFLNRVNPRLDYKLRILYKVAKVNTWYFPLSLKNAFKGFNNIIKLPVKYDISHKIMDGFASNDFWKNMYFKMNDPIMRGVDTIGRNFLLFKYYDLTNKREIIEVFFNNTLNNRDSEDFELKEYINLTVFPNEIEYDYWEYNGKWGKTLLGDYFFEYKDTVRQLNIFNFNLIKKLLTKKRMSIPTKYYCLDDEQVTTSGTIDNYVEITLDHLEYVRTCISGLSQAVLGK
jgi:hypothetical protein